MSTIVPVLGSTMFVPAKVKGKAATKAMTARTLHCIVVSAKYYSPAEYV